MVVGQHAIALTDAWDFREINNKPLDLDVDHPIHIVTGTHIAQPCPFLLTKAHYSPGRLLQAQPRRGKSDGA